MLGHYEYTSQLSPLLHKLFNLLDFVCRIPSKTAEDKQSSHKSPKNRDKSGMQLSSIVRITEDGSLQKKDSFFPSHFYEKMP